MKKNLWWLWIVLIILILVIVGFSVFKFVVNREKPSNTKTTVSWREKDVAISGQYADAEVVDLGDGKYRMYYSIEPEVSNNNLEIYSSVSTDGITWTKEEGIRKTMATFPDMVKLPDGRWRMYFQSAGVIKSAVSADGLNWTDETGIRIDKEESGFSIDNVGAQSTTIFPDKTFAMVYRGTINKPYQTSEKIPNQATDIYFWATSKDGLVWQKKGLAIDSRSEILYGMADGAEWVKWDNSELRIYFWSYTGIYHVVYKDGSFSAPVFDWSNNKDSQIKFPPNPPGDPTLIKINSTWFMYYGQHTKGIYYAIKAKE